MTHGAVSHPALPPGIPAEQLVALHETAADWLVRRQSGDWSADDARALAAWMDAQPLHRDIFANLERTRQLAAQLPRRAAPRPVERPRPRMAWRTLVPALAVLACLLLGGGWFAWDRAPRYQSSLATGPGETRQVDLPDGSQVVLNVGSRLEVRYEAHRRVLALAQGEAFFRVAPDARRPFSVDAGHSRVTVVGTAFNLRTAPSTLVLQVQQGQVELRPDLRAAPGAVLRLGPGAGIAVDAVTGRHQAVPAPVEAVGDWRSGHLRLQRMPLGEVAEELARYLGRPVVLAGPELAQLPVSGYLATAAPEGFLELLPDLVPVRVRREAGGWTIAPR
ncbi:MAG: FecR domain-containing protein [Pseudorhodoferax sp.]